MNKTNFVRVATVVFLVVAVVHFYRALNNLPLIIGEYMVPVEYSVVGALLALFLCYSGYRHWR
jgi:hypothetical protein